MTGPVAIAAIELVDEIGVNAVKISSDILISAAIDDQETAALMSTWLAHAVSKGFLDDVTDAPGLLSTRAKGDMKSEG